MIGSVMRTNHVRTTVTGLSGDSGIQLNMTRAKTATMYTSSRLHSRPVTVSPGVPRWSVSGIDVLCGNRMMFVVADHDVDGHKHVHGVGDLAHLAVAGVAQPAGEVEQPASRVAI